MPFNEGQLKAIQQRNSSILVSAPAGSGKTKILVSRIVELLKEGYHIFDFLVLTFTEAAGNEMKQRLSEELNELVVSDIDEQLRTHLQQQILDLPNAYITNFHGFCNLLLMKYGYMVNVMPGFTINSDPTLIKQEVLQECLETWIQDENIQEFLSLYFPGYSLDAFQGILLNIDNLSHSIDNFYQFIDDIYQNNYASLSTSLEDWNLFPYLKNIFYNEAIFSLNKLIELQYYCETHNLVDFYERPDEQTEKNQLLPIPFNALYDYIDERIKAFQSQLTYDTFMSYIMTPIPKSYNMSWKEIDPEIKKTFTKMKADIFSSYNKSISSYIPENVDDFIKKMNISYQAINIMLSKGNLLSQFQDAYQTRKKELNQLDFSDLEKYAHQLLEPQYGIVDILHHSLKEIMVDEYQDTNQIQESLLLKIANYQEPHIPLFMVGDMKQSIYRFRQADPQIFSDKYNTFSLSDEDCQKTQTRRIDLVFNYRSSKIVLDSINYIFNQVMDTHIGGLEYYLDDSARLNYDYDGKENGHKKEARERFFSEKHLKTEILIDIYNPASSYTKEEYEAHMVAQKIVDLKKNFRLKNKPISYQDIVVLMRSTPSFLTFKKVFDLYHIPNHIVLSQGLMSSVEIIDMMTFLKAIINPYDDVALLSILRQPYSFTHINLETIALLRIDHKDIPLFECLQNSTDETIINFLNVYQELREYAYQHSPYELLLKIYDITDYPLFVSQLINGQQRKANLDLFLEIVKQNQQTTPYLKDLIYALENSSDYAPAQSSNGDNDVVEFMTIHKSKGLEFPIVFVCHMHKQFNTQDSKERFMIDKHLGIALKPRVRMNQEDIQDVIVEYENCYRNMIARHQLDESINEEMRILYVALTRASHKLILTGVIKDIDEVVNLQQKLLVNESPDIYHREGAQKVLLYDRLRKTNNYLSWVLSAILRHPQVIEQCLQINELKPRAQLLKEYHFEKHLTFDSTEHAMFFLQFTTDKNIEDNIPKYQKEDKVINGSLQAKYDNYIYPYDIEKTSTIAVTKLQALEDDHYLNLDTQEDHTLLSASDKGTLVHLFMSYLTFKEDNFDILLEQLYQEELINEQGKEVLIQYRHQIEGFINSEYYQMISHANYIYKEKPFAYYDKQKEQIVHGIFDLVFVYQNQVYVLDYKTDRVSQKNSEQALILKHQVQLNYYQKVLKDMYKQDIQAIVYYLHISKGVNF